MMMRVSHVRLDKKYVAVSRCVSTVCATVGSGGLIDVSAE